MLSTHLQSVCATHQTYRTVVLPGVAMALPLNLPVVAAALRLARARAYTGSRILKLTTLSVYANAGMRTWEDEIEDRVEPEALGALNLYIWSSVGEAY